MTLLSQHTAPTTQIEKTQKKRLLFIDMARSIAILLMLEGHFISSLFKSHRPMVDAFILNGTSDNLFFDIWHLIRGCTAPMFFTVTGIVFVFLLIDNEKKIRENARIKKGIRRSIELILWGYFLQMNIFSVDKYVMGNFPPYVSAFHVLQSIGIGLFVLLLLYVLQRTLKFGNIAVYYFVVATIIIAFYPSLNALPKGVYFPENAPRLVQNMFRGQNSVFPIIPWLAFTLYGGMIGAIVKKYRQRIQSFFSIALFLGIGLFFSLFSFQICTFVDLIMRPLYGNNNIYFTDSSWIFARFGTILFVLGILILIEKGIKLQNNLFLKIGQNTLPIYIVHSIILYGGIFGFGLTRFFGKQLSGMESVIGACLFILFFVVMIRYWDGVERWWEKLKIKIRKIFVVS